MAVDTLIVGAQKDAEGEFFRKFNQSGSCGTIRVITASGTEITRPDRNWEKTLGDFKKLPQEERMPNVGALTNPDRRAPLNRLPQGALRIKLYSRGLERDGEGELVSKSWKENWQKLSSGGDWPAKAEPGYDYLWLTEADWKTLVPAEMKKGHQYALPKSLVKKIVCDPLTHNAWARNPPIWWNPKHLRSLEVDLTVTEVTATNVLICLQGTVLLEAPLKDAFNGHRAKTRKGEPIVGDHKLKFDGRMLGYLAYDLQKKALTRFDVVALGDYVGFYCDTNGLGEILSLPLGVAYTVDTGPPVPPGLWHRDDPWWRD
ncbi:MAG: hypothetical protein EXR98_18165 [Gemmataceae bacterium]|nr:hypothetical protein [Gemmataceae bacterium]